MSEKAVTGFTLPSEDLPIRVKDKPRLIDRYLPAGFPQLLFQGTSLDNARGAQRDGLGAGSLSSWLWDCLNSRFYRKENGRLLVAIYNPDVFITEDVGSKANPYQYYTIREKTGPSRLISYSNVDTDGVASSSDAPKERTDRYVDPRQMGSLELSSQQREYLDLISSMLSYSKYSLLGSFDERELRKVAAMLRKYNLPDSAAGVAGGGVTMQMTIDAHLDEGADYHYRLAMRQNELAKIFGLQATDFKDLETLRQAIDTDFSDEELFLDKAVSQFPGQLQWDWNNIGLEDREVVKTIIRQLYQKEIVDRIKAQLMNLEIQSETLMLKGKSREGLDRLQQERKPH